VPASVYIVAKNLFTFTFLEFCFILNKQIFKNFSNSKISLAYLVRFEYRLSFFSIWSIVLGPKVCDGGGLISIISLYIYIYSLFFPFENLYVYCVFSTHFICSTNWKCLYFYLFKIFFLFLKSKILLSIPIKKITKHSFVLFFFKRVWSSRLRIHGALVFKKLFFFSDL
jgi:hypothetical protein